MTPSSQSDREKKIRDTLWSPEWRGRCVGLLMKNVCARARSSTVFNALAANECDALVCRFAWQKWPDRQRANFPTHLFFFRRRHCSTHPISARSLADVSRWLDAEDARVCTSRMNIYEISLPLLLRTDCIRHARVSHSELAMPSCPPFGPVCRVHKLAALLAALNLY